MVIESMFILKCEYTVQRMVALNVFNEVMSLLTSFADSHVTYLSVRLLLLALLRLFIMPNLPESISQSPLPLFNLVLTLANTAYGYYEEKRNGNEEEEVDYEELLERIEGGTFRDNDWGYDEEQDVNSDDDKDLKDMNLKQLEALSGLEGDCSEIDEHLINVVTTMNEMQTFQSTVKVMVNRLVHCRS